MWTRSPAGGVTTEGWVVGHDPFSVGPPEYSLEFGVVSALWEVEQHLDEKLPTRVFFALKAGTWRTIRAIRSWFDAGRLPLVAAAAGERAR